MSAHCRPERQPEMPALPRRPASPGARPCQGRSSLDKACAPAEYGSCREARTGTISQIEVSTLSGEPRARLGVLEDGEVVGAWLWATRAYVRDRLPDLARF